MIGVSVRTGPVRWRGLPVLLVWLVGRLLVGVGVLVYAAVCRPRATVAWLGLFGFVWLLLAHPVAVLGAAVLVVYGCDAWALLHPSSWRRRGRLALLGRWRALWTYRRRWRTAMRVADLTRDGDRGVEVPRLVRVRSLEHVDVVHVRALLGQRFPAWEEAAPMLAHVFGAGDYRLHRGDDRRLTLELLRAPRGRSWHRGGVLELAPPD